MNRNEGAKRTAISSKTQRESMCVIVFISTFNYDIHWQVTEFRDLLPGGNLRYKYGNEIIVDQTAELRQHTGEFPSDRLNGQIQ